MSLQQPTHQFLIQSIVQSPQTLNKLTQSYIQLLSTSTYTSNTASWQSIQVVLESINQEQTELQVKVLMFNVAKHVLGETLGISSLKDNRIYGWMTMKYGVQTDKVISRIDEQIKKIQTEHDAKLENQGEILNSCCFGLLLSEIMIGTAQGTNRCNTSNKIIFPELYRLLNYILEVVCKYFQILPNSIIHYSHDKQTDEEQKQQENKLRVTDILKKIRVKGGKKNKKQNDHGQIGSAIVAKIIQLILRSFNICKIKSIKKMNIIQQLINKQLKNILDKEQFDEGQSNPILGLQIKKYLAVFEEFKKTDGETAMEQEEIDEDNKIIEVKELTPRFLDEGPNAEIKKLRIKKKKLTKKIQADMRTARLNKLQELKVVQDVRNERSSKKQKKQMFILEKQTSQAKKEHNKMKKVKQIQKQSKGSKGIKGPKGKGYKKLRK